MELYRSVEDIRLVTTNFDQHFETAAQEHFERLPRIHQAPALPLGDDFSGIVYLHGSIMDPQSLVMTDASFGRAYLTKGWARRFLVDVFQKYTVLFVGYSHDDAVMNYLARALPPASVKGRFALTEKGGAWDILGITPVYFSKDSCDEESYKELYDGVRCFGEMVQRGALGWKAVINEIARLAPPSNEEATQELDQAFREFHTIKFFTNDARHSDWPLWLQKHGHLKGLFSRHELDEKNILLAKWLVEHYFLDHPKVAFDILTENSLVMSPTLWFFTCRHIGTHKCNGLATEVLERWVSILLINIPERGDFDALLWLAQYCAKSGLSKLVLKVFLCMAEHRLITDRSRPWSSSGEDQDNWRIDYSIRAGEYPLRKIWDDNLKPELQIIDERLTEGLVYRLESIHLDLVIWSKSVFDGDLIFWRRSAIEAHEQDRYPGAVDVLIDALRDALESIISTSENSDFWIERLSASKAPILRRLAIHGISLCLNKSADDRLIWILGRFDLNAYAEHHELYRSIGLAYPLATEVARSQFVKKLMGTQLAETERRSAEDNTSRFHFDWLSWVLLAKDDCGLATEMLEPILEKYPDWEASDHPDFMYWSSVSNRVGSTSPWSVDQLLDKSVQEQIDELLGFQSDGFDGVDRWGLTSCVQEACKNNLEWALSLADILHKRSNWTSDLWGAFFRGLGESVLALQDQEKIFTVFYELNLTKEFPGETANMLRIFAKNGLSAPAFDSQANKIALRIWSQLGSDELDDGIDDWLSKATNRPAGILVDFWLSSLSSEMKGKNSEDRYIPENYKRVFADIVQESSLKGDFGRTVLASQMGFLYGLDQEWTKQYLVPLFSVSDPQIAQQSWDGFLTWGRLNTSLADSLFPALVSALDTLYLDNFDKRRRFIDLFTVAAIIHSTLPRGDFLGPLFRKGDEQDLIVFTSRIGELLRHLELLAKEELWRTWLREYWETRLKGSPRNLFASEVRKMLGWLGDMDDLYPQGVAYAVKSDPVDISDTYFLHRLNKSGLPRRYEADTAKLLIYLSECLKISMSDHVISHLLEIKSSLVHLNSDLQARLDEALAQIGV